MEKESGLDEEARGNDQECAICLQSMELPVELPCKSVIKKKLSRFQSTLLLIYADTNFASYA